jgi:hypothetical protein
MKLNRLSLNVVGLNRIGLNQIGSPSRGSSSGTDRPYIDPEVLASLKAVCICYGKSNDDPDRAVVKNLVDPDNPFVISNAAYTEGSGYADKDSPYYGAFVTDGIDDLITSTKTVQEMLGGSNEITVVSMAHFIKGESNAPEICRINQIRRDTRSIRNSISKIGKSGIFGYTYKNGVTTINNILGNKNDCTAEGNLDGIVAPFSVEGYYYNNNSNPLELCSIAWYWTIIANKVLITDQINQVIAYFNLDRTLKPDILCNTIKQGITNENHAEFGDKLIDFSGNGRDIQLNNIAWNKESGIDDDGALRLDGVNDFGKVTGMPIYKDYTVVADREIIDGLVENADGGVALKGSRYLTGAFCFDYKDAAFSFGTPKMIPLDTKRFISYQSKYVSNGISINIGTATDNDELWIGRLGNDERYSKIAIRFLMSFPYSMSEFLIERQLKKHKLGTLYPDMVEFRPIVKSNLPYSSISYSVNPGEYISVDSMVTITVTLPNTSDKLMEVSCNAISDISISGDNGVYEITGKIVKSPQKINLVISSYLTMLNNETLISNETLIKNE